MAITSSGEIKFSDIASNQGTGNADVELKAKSEVFAASAATVGDRSALDAAPYALSEFYSAHFPNTYFDNPIAKLSTTAVTSNGFVDGETGRIYFDVNADQGGTTDYTAGLKLASDDSVVVSSTQGSANPLRDLSVADDTHYAEITIPDISAGTPKYYPYVTTGTYVNAAGSNINHYDQLASGTPGLSETSRNVDAADESVSNISITPAVSTGTQTSYTRGSITSVTAGDGHTMTGTYVIEDGQPTDAVVIAHVPGVIRFNMTHYGAPSTARNTVTSTQDYTISYNRAIDISVNDNTVNSGTAFTITAVSEGLTGAATMPIGYSTSNSDTNFTSYVNKSIGAATNFVRNSQNQAFTVTLTSGTSLATYYGKALYSSGAATVTATSAIYIAPALSYSTTGNQTINVNTTQAFAASSIVGNSAAVAISSSPSAGSGTNSATITPGTNNRVYTISFAGTANYSQTSNTTDTLTVNPTVSLSLSDNQGGDNYPITDAHSSTITSGTHGVSPTLFTVAPTVVGDTVTYAWTTSGFTFTSGGGSTAGTVIFKKDSSGTTSQTLTVSGNSTSANDAVSIVAQSVTKAFTGGTKPATLRAGTTFSVTSVAANYTQTVHLLRDGVTIGAAASIASTMNFSIAASNSYTNNYDGDATATYLRDNDNTDITRNLGNTILLPPLPVIDSFSATQDDYLKKIDLAWTTTSATAVSLDESLGSQSVDGSVTKSGLLNNESVTFTLTATNAASEAVTEDQSATTITPSISIGSEADTSFVYGDTGNYTVAFTKNFKDAIEVHAGHALVSGSETGGTEWEILTGQGNGATSFNATLHPNYFAGSTFGSIVDYRAGSDDAGWFLFNQNRSFADFTTPGVPSSLAAGVTTGNAIAMSWSNPGGQTGVILAYAETADGIFTEVSITSGATGADITGLTVGTQYDIKIKAFTTKTTTPLGGSESRTNSSAFSSVVQQTTVGWNSIIIEADSLSGTTSGVGYSTQEAAALSDDVRVTLYYLDSTTLGSDTVVLKRAIDGASWDGNADWFGVGALADRAAVAYIANNTGQITAANYILIANALPIAPTNMTFTSVSSTAITINWEDNSGIEDGFKVYMNTGGAATSAHTLINTASENATSYAKTSGLSAGVTYYFAVYAYNGSIPTLSSVLQGSRATDAANTFGTWDVALNVQTFGEGDDAESTGDVEISLSGQSGTVAVSIVSSEINGSQGDIAYAIKAGGGSWSSFSATPSVSVTSPSSLTIYVKCELTQNKEPSGNETGTEVIKVTCNGVSSPNVNVNWTISETI